MNAEDKRLKLTKQVIAEFARNDNDDFFEKLQAKTTPEEQILNKESSSTRLLKILPGAARRRKLRWEPKRMRPLSLMTNSTGTFWRATRRPSPAWSGCPITSLSSQDPKIAPWSDGTWRHRRKLSSEVTGGTRTMLDTLTRLCALLSHLTESWWWLEERTELSESGMCITRRRSLSSWDTETRSLELLWIERMTSSIPCLKIVLWRCGIWEPCSTWILTTGTPEIFSPLMLTPRTELSHAVWTDSASSGRSTKTKSSSTATPATPSTLSMSSTTSTSSLAPLTTPSISGLSTRKSLSFP